MPTARTRVEAQIGVVQLAPLRVERRRIYIYNDSPNATLTLGVGFEPSETALTTRVLPRTSWEEKTGAPIWGFWSSAEGAGEVTEYL